MGCCSMPDREFPKRLFCPRLTLLCNFLPVTGILLSCLRRHFPSNAFELCRMMEGTCLLFSLIHETCAERVEAIRILRSDLYYKSAFHVSVQTGYSPLQSS